MRFSKGTPYGVRSAPYTYICTYVLYVSQIKAQSDLSAFITRYSSCTLKEKGQREIGGVQWLVEVLRF